MKKPKISTLKNKLWKLVVEHVRRRDKNICQKCGKYVTGRQSETSHIIPKSHGNVLRYEPLNLMVKCFTCHRWWHSSPTESGEWFKSKFPSRWEYLQEHKNDTVHWKVNDYLRMIEEARSWLE